VKSALLQESQNSQENQNPNPNQNISPEAPLGTVKPAEVVHAEMLDQYRQEGQQLGFRNMPVASLPSKGDYYPIDCKIEFRALTLEEVKYYSSMDENDVFDVNDKIYSVLGKGVRVWKNGKRGSYRDLSETDKIYMLFALRDLTMQQHKREMQLTQVVQCKNCPEKTKINLSNDIFGYYQLSDGMRKWYSELERCFVVEHHKIGNPLKIYVPTIGVVDAINNLVKQKEIEKRKGEGGYYDKTFVMFLQFLVPSWEMVNDTFFTRMYTEYTNWSYDRHQAMAEAAEKINLGIKPSIDVTCSGGHVTNAKIRFRKGFRSILDISGIGEELFGDSE
jgi:hypothetical protein